MIGLVALLGCRHMHQYRNDNVAVDTTVLVSTDIDTSGPVISDSIINSIAFAIIIPPVSSWKFIDRQRGRDLEIDSKLHIDTGMCTYIDLQKLKRTKGHEQYSRFKRYQTAIS